MPLPLPPPSETFPLAAPPAAARRDPRARIRRFASPLTRMLLSSEGLTTTLLESLAGETLQLHCLAQLPAPARAAGSCVPVLLRVADTADVLVRHSTLTRASGQPLSLNHVVARLGPGLPPTVQAGLTGRHAPLGPALHAAGIGHRRTLLDAGRRRWGAGAACYKTYLVWHEDQPLVLINELFNPALVPAE